MKSLLLFSTLLLVSVFAGWREARLDRSENIKSPARAVFCAPSFDPAKMNEANAPIFKGLGNLHVAVSTKSKKAQQYFDQGLTLIYAFNHGEAGRSFLAAIKNDSTLAMAYWGLAMVLGPNYNAALNPTSLADINNAMDKALRYSHNSTPKEKALIQALAKRFPKTETKDVSGYYAAYATAMKELYEQYPNDADIIALYGDALMNEHPWDLWERNGSPKEWTPRIIDVLERGLQQFPQHPGINHSYIHAIEASATPEKGLPSSDRLTALLPAAGHLVHMPAHIYIRTGDYHKGVLTTENATVADSTYIAQCKVQGAYPMMYYPHNVHFLAACAFFEGNSKKALEAAWMVSRKADRAYLAELVSVQHYYIIPFYVMVQMAKWDEILQQPAPGEGLKYPRAIWHYARGMAYGAKGNLQQAQQEWEALKKIAEDGSLKTELIWEINSAGDLVNIAALTLQGELAMHRGQYAQSIEAYKKAIDIEDKLMYQEPPDWFFSVRHSLGHVLVKSGAFAEAEKIYQEDLFIYRENGWSLIGLYNSLQGQQKNEEAAAVKKRFDKAWAFADIRITSSRHY